MLILLISMNFIFEQHYFKEEKQFFSDFVELVDSSAQKYYLFIFIFLLCFSFGNQRDFILSPNLVTGSFSPNIV